MADGDVLTLDSAQPGGSGSIDGEDKFNWVAPTPPSAASVLGLSAYRVIGSGSNAITTGARTVVLTFTRNANERVFPLIFQSTTTAGGGETNSWELSAGAFHIYLRRTNVANECQLELHNSTGGTLTMDWLLIGMVPL